jgi:hypothetical protein
MKSKLSLIFQISMICCAVALAACNREPAKRLEQKKRAEQSAKKLEKIGKSADDMARRKGKEVTEPLGDQPATTPSEDALMGSRDKGSANEAAALAACAELRGHTVSLQRDLDAKLPVIEEKMKAAETASLDGDDTVFGREIERAKSEVNTLKGACSRFTDGIETQKERCPQQSEKDAASAVQSNCEKLNGLGGKISVLLGETL